MVDFGDTQANDIPVEFQPLPGVENKAAAIAAQGSANAINTLAQGVQNFGSFISGQRAKSAQSANQGVVAQYTLNLTNIAHAQQQGGLTMAEAQTRSRALFTSSIASNPSLLGEISAAHKTVVNTSGIGNIISEGTQEQQRFSKLVDDAVNSGFIPPNATDAQQQVGIELFQERVRIQEQMSFENARLQNQTNKNEFDVQADKVRSQGLLGNLSLNEFQRSNITLDGLLNQVESGQITPEEAISQANSNLAVINQTASQIGQASGGSYVDDMMDPTRKLYDNFNKRVSGELGADIYKQQNERILGQQKQNILGDPQTARVVASTQLLGPSASGALAVNEAVVKAIGNMVTENPSKSNTPNLSSSNPSEKVNNKNTLSIIRDNVDSKDEGIQGEVSNSITNTLKGVNIYEQAVDDPTSYKEVVDFLADPKVGKWMSSNSVDPEVVSTSKEVFKREYSDVLLPLIKDSYNDAITPSGNAVSGEFGLEIPKGPVPDLVQLNWKGDGAVFEYNGPALEGESEIQMRQTIKGLNSTVAPHVNRLTRLGSHLDGNQEYRKTFEEQILPAIIPQAAQEPEKTSQAPQVPEPTITPPQTPSEGLTDPANKKVTIEGQSPEASAGNVALPEGVVPQSVDQQLSDFEPIKKANEESPFVDKTTEEVSEFKGAFDALGDSEGTDKGEGYNETLAEGAFTNGKVDLVNMTLDEIAVLQEDMLAHPDNRFDSSAVGRYQIVGETLQGLIRNLGLSGSEKFTPELQDRMAMALMEGRGLSKWKAGKISDAKFLASLDKEWPSINSGRVDPEAILNALKGTGGNEALAAIDTAVPTGAKPVGLDDGSLAFASKSNNPLFVANQGASSKVRDGATEKMDEVLKGPFQKAQELFGAGIVINDAIAKEGTSREGNTPGSRHFHGDALDISTKGLSNAQKLKLVESFKKAGFTGFGFGNTILHVDMGKSRAWNYNNTKFAGVPVADMIAKVKKKG